MKPAYGLADKVFDGWFYATAHTDCIEFDSELLTYILCYNHILHEANL